MKTGTIIFLIILLIGTDQAVKIIIYTFFMNNHGEIIPSLLEFNPVFNDKHSYVNVLLYKHFHINLGLGFHLILFTAIQIIFLGIYDFFKKTLNNHTKILDVALAFQIAGVACSLIGNLIWEKGTLDYIYLKPLFIFDLKDLYVHCFTILFFIYLHKNRVQLKTVKTKQIIIHLGNRLTNKNNKR